MSDYEKAKQAAAKKLKADEAATEKDIKSKTNKEQSAMLAKLKGQVDEEKKPGGLASTEDPTMEKIKKAAPKKK
jgi:hypothetical protein